jgi:superfamily I DNA/RNA helicase
MREIDIPIKALQSIKQFIDIILESRIQFKETALPNAFSWLIKRIDYNKVIQEETSSEKGEKFRLENLEQLKTLIQKYTEETPDSQLDGFIHEILLQSKTADFSNGSKEPNGVNLLTELFFQSR